MLTGLRSRKHIEAFDLVRPTSIEGCLSCLSEGPRIGLMAGGLDLIDRMKSGETFDTVVALSGIPQLNGIHQSDSAIIVGALTTHATLARDPVVAERLPDLAKLWREIANPRVRHTGTIGGNLMSHCPHYDAMPALMALGATATIAEPTTGMRSVPLDQLPGMQTLLVNIAIPATGSRLVADRSLHPSVSVYASAILTAGAITQLHLVFGCAYPRPILVALPVRHLQHTQLGSQAADLAEIATRALPEPLGDGFASARYRRRMLDVLTRRLLVRLGSAL